MAREIRRAFVLLAPGLALTLASGSSAVASTCPADAPQLTASHTSAEGPRVAPWTNGALSVPKFVAANGETLTRVDVELSVGGAATLQLTNLGDTPCTMSYSHGLSVTIASGEPALPLDPHGTSAGTFGLQPLEPGETVHRAIDYNGTADVTQTFELAADLAFFTGAPGETFDFVTSATTSLSASGCNGSADSEERGTTRVRVTYTWCRPTPVCNEDADVEVVPTSASTPAIDGSWSAQTLVVPQLPPTFGLLGRVDVVARLSTSGDAGLENTDALPRFASWSATTTADVQLDPALGLADFSVESTSSRLTARAGFDGAVDFGGTSGRTWSAVPGVVERTFAVVDPVALAQWQGWDDVSFDVSGVLTTSADGGPGLEHYVASSAVVELEVRYVICPPPAGFDAYCFGDGSGTPCPCGNPGITGHGCANSQFPGATFEAFGSSSVAADDLSFASAWLPAGQPALLYVGESAVEGGFGVGFGDGLRCAGTNARRLELSFADASGRASFGPGLQSAGEWAAGDTRYFQVWYRDPNGGPCGSTFNLTSAISGTFHP